MDVYAVDRQADGSFVARGVGMLLPPVVTLSCDAGEFVVNVQHCDMPDHGPATIRGMWTAK